MIVCQLEKKSVFGLEILYGLADVIYLMPAINWNVDFHKHIVSLLGYMKTSVYNLLECRLLAAQLEPNGTKFPYMAG